MTYPIVLQPKGLAFNCEPGQTVYDAALQAGIGLPAACRNGVCHICRARVIHGLCQDGELVGGDGSELLLCKARPLSACEFFIKEAYAPGELSVKTIVCQRESIEVIQANVYRVRLLLPAGKQPSFHAGQYLAILLPGKDEPMYFSIACAPGGRQLELHIQADPHLLSAVQLIDYLQQNASVRIALPYGKACLSAVPDCPVLLIAAGTGFAQMKSLLEFLFAQGFRQPVHLYWGARRAEDLYLTDLALQWQARHHNFHFHSLVAATLNDSGQGAEHRQRLAEKVLKDNLDLPQYLCYISGSASLVFTTMKALAAQGLRRECIFSDVFEYAKDPD